MRVVRIIDGEPTLTDAPMPADPNQFRVKVAAVGICGSDLHMIDNGMAEGRVLGHEISGRLDDGTPVAVEPLRSCGHCGNCREGERHRCDAGADIIGVFSDGGMGEYLMVPAEALVRLASGIEVTDASLVENLAVAVHAVNRARMQSGERVGEWTRHLTPTRSATSGVPLAVTSSVTPVVSGTSTRIRHA